MNTQSNAMPDSVDSQRTAAAMRATRPFYWSVRREIWENRSLYIAPVAVAALFLLGFLVSMGRFPGKIRGALAMDAARQLEVLEQPYDFAALLLMGTYLIVAAFYCLDALYGERRDRSILFWKSLPVSDFTIVMSKASIPLVILPLFIFTTTIAMQCVMVVLSSVVLGISGLGFGTLWTHLPFVHMSVGLFYHLIGVHAIYYAPIYGWLLLVSGWARRAPFMWAALPAFAIGIVEKIAFNTTHFAAMLGSRLGGGPDSIPFPATDASPMHRMEHFVPINFLLSPGLWLGLVVCAAFLAAAVRLRRQQGPI